jgi:hypothetical protein
MFTNSGNYEIPFQTCAIFVNVVCLDVDRKNFFFKLPQNISLPTFHSLFLAILFAFISVTSSGFSVFRMECCRFFREPLRFESFLIKCYSIRAVTCFKELLTVFWNFLHWISKEMVHRLPLCSLLKITLPLFDTST